VQTDKDSREDILKVFSLFDVEGKGKITVRDLKRVAKELGETMTGALRCRCCWHRPVSSRRPPHTPTPTRRGGAHGDD